MRLLRSHISQPSHRPNASPGLHDVVLQFPSGHAVHNLSFRADRTLRSCLLLLQHHACSRQGQGPRRRTSRPHRNTQLQELQTASLLLRPAVPPAPPGFTQDHPRRDVVGRLDAASQVMQKSEALHLRTGGRRYADVSTGVHRSYYYYYYYYYYY